ncbi:MAG TPA: aminotransferase class I/II-fold pyridoxal phosphate-dependent enzyme, partial [Acidimicrobiales bacterium]|nr:aminotransferase class I/II-fold pyridoxal phosphate-dependent enzyme [Acidimicrobiales bacterium]
PTGAVLAINRRREIAGLLDGSPVPLVEDAALADLAWAQLPPPIASFCASASVALVGSLSKVFWGGLRVGWVRAPEPIALRFARVKATQDLGSSAVSQLLADRLLRLAGVGEFVAERKRELRQRYDVLAAHLRHRLPDWTWDEPAGGMSIWVRVPTPDVEAFSLTCLRHGVAVATASALSPSAAPPDRLRISFSAPGSALIEGAERLAAAWAVHVGR